MTDKEEILNDLEAQARTADADLEELTVAPQTQIEELSEVREEKNSLEEEVEELSEKVEELSDYEEQVEKVATIYAEALSDAFPAFDEEELVDRFDVEELRTKYEDAVEEGQIEQLATSGTPNVRSGDGGNGSHQANQEELGQGGEPDEEVEEAADMLDKRGGAWSELADDLREDGI